MMNNSENAKMLLDLVMAGISNIIVPASQGQEMGLICTRISPDIVKQISALADVPDGTAFICFMNMSTGSGKLFVGGNTGNDKEDFNVAVKQMLTGVMNVVSEFLGEAAKYNCDQPEHIN